MLGKLRSTETEESVLDQTFDGDMESVVEVENRSVGSSSTGLLGMQGLETSPAKVEKLLSIHGKAQEKVRAWIVKAGWQNVHRGHHRLNGRADLTHDSPPFHEIALAEIEYLKVAVATRTHNTIAAVARNPALEAWVPDSPAASKAWEVAKVAFGLKNSAACEDGQMSFEGWQAANPAGFKPWWQTVAAASEAWDLVSFKVKIAETEVAAAVQAVALLIQEAAKAQDVAASGQETVLKDRCDVADLKNQWDMLNKGWEQAKDEASQDEQKAMEIGFQRLMKFWMVLQRSENMFGGGCLSASCSRSWLTNAQCAK
ncbi:unnamed protein product [Sphagnum jensenii]|uniref:Uncharacterized protein n=1 Tax=Sphagnum jensenii TaxID=128206 RepID=A0ABP1AKL6_9BRYO